MSSSDVQSEDAVLQDDGGSVSAANMPVLGIDDPDIGMCDLCGTGWGRRHRTIVVRTYEGAPRRVVAWLCGPCKRREQRPAHESCPECGVRWGYHRGVSCAVAEQRERALDHAD